MDQRGVKRQRANPLSSKDQSLSPYEDKLWLWAYLLEEYPTETDWYSSWTMFSSFRMRKIACFPDAERSSWSILFPQHHPIHTLLFFAPQRSTFHYEERFTPVTVSLLTKPGFPPAAVQGNPASPVRLTPVTCHTVTNRPQSKHHFTLPSVICLHLTTNCCRGPGVCFQCLILLPLGLCSF